MNLVRDPYNWLVPASCHAFKIPLPVDVHESWPFGDTFFWRFFRWWCNLDWDPTSPLIETYFHFCCSTGTMAPVLVGSNLTGIGPGLMRLLQNNCGSIFILKKELFAACNVLGVAIVFCKQVVEFCRVFCLSLGQS